MLGAPAFATCLPSVTAFFSNGFSAVVSGTMLHGGRSTEHNLDSVRKASNRAGRSLVSVPQVSIHTNGRYSSCRLLEHDYKLDSKVLGAGISGPVRLATGKEDGRKYAVKSFSKTRLSTQDRDHIKSEAEIYLSLDHPHVARLEMVYETEDELHLVMEFMEGGELYRRLSERKQYSEGAAADTAHQMLLAVAYLHAHSMVHRDLKLENYMYERENSEHLKLIDFGFAKIFDGTGKMSQACGSIHYVAPEVLGHSYTEKADMWSLGVLVYMLLVGTSPFRGSECGILQKIRDGQPSWSQRFYRLSAAAKDFVKALLSFDPSKRLSAASALEHRWVASRHKAEKASLDVSLLCNLRRFARASHFRRATLWIMAWSLSTDDLAELRKQFLLLDTDNRGTITHAQLKNALMKNSNVDGIEAETVFSSLDTDNDDEIEYTEFLAAASLGRVNFHQDVLRRTFSRFDRNGDGKIDHDEFRAVLGDTFECSEIEELIREADTSGDGQIDYDEFLAYFHKTEPEAEEEPTAHSKRTRYTEKLGVMLDKLLLKSRGASHVESRSASAPTALLQHSGTGSVNKETAALPSLLRRRSATGALTKTGVNRA